MTSTLQLIRAKRDGAAMSPEAIRAFMAGIVDGSVADYQAAALLMAICWRGMTDDELLVWTDAMLHSGQVLDLSSLSGPKVDKHSTGGVGDKVSIALAPLVAACGLNVPMISGRGLGHTGGTLDKLEAIPGFNTRLDPDRFVSVVEQAGLSLIGQTDDLAPADRRLYALRDASGTVESIPLIASSIMSKKLAAGLDALVLDLKVGSGAFMKQLEQARALGTAIRTIGKRAGLRVTAVISDMNQPLGREIGNASEVREAIKVLQGSGPADLWELIAELGAEMLLLGGVVDSRDAARERLAAARGDGSALQRLRRCVELQGGDPRVVDDPMLLPQAAHRREVRSDGAGVLTGVDAERVGLAAMLLGAGRRRVDDVVDHTVGLTFHVRIGQRLQHGDALATLHYNRADELESAERMVRDACRLDDRAQATPPLIYEVLR